MEEITLLSRLLKMQKWHTMQILGQVFNTFMDQHMLYTFLLGIMVFIHIGTTDGDLIRGMFIMVMCILIILFTDIVGITGHIMHTNIITTCTHEYVASTNTPTHPSPPI